MMSLPLPPRIMLPAPNDVTPAPRNSCNPAIRPMLVRMLPFTPEVEMAAASRSSPLRMSLWDEPARPSMNSKRVSKDAVDGVTGVSSKARRSNSMLTPCGSSRNTAQSKPEAPT
ncbi:hypothetical protein D3C85_1402350 [compost metagenome]